MNIEKNVPLAPYTTFGIGGPALFLICVKNVEELKEALSFAAQVAQLILQIQNGTLQPGQ